MMNHLHEFLVFSDSKQNRSVLHLEDSLTAFSQITKIPVSYFDTEGRYCWSTLPEERLCNANLEYEKKGTPCTRNLLASMNISLSLPDAYIFMYEAGLIHLCFALIASGKEYGFLMAGPIAMGNDMEKMIGAFFRKTPAETMDYTCLMTLLRKMTLYTPREIAYLSTLFQNSVTGAISFSREEDLRAQRNQEQNGISSRLQQMKKEQLTLEYPHASEELLTSLIKSGNHDACQKQFSKYIGDIMVFEGGNLSITKLRLIAFITHLLQHDDTWQRNYENLYALEKINEAKTLRELMQIGKTLIAALADTAADRFYAGSSHVIKKLILHLNVHYSDDITLQKAADMVHVNPTYLSTLFKQETGLTFTAYLNRLRIRHGEDMLLNTNLSVTEIAMAAGFSSPGYFTNVFRQVHGITPREFRNRPAK